VQGRRPLVEAELLAGLAQIDVALQTAVRQAHREAVVAQVRDLCLPRGPVRSRRALQVFQRQPALRFLADFTQLLQPLVQCVQLRLVAEPASSPRSTALICRCTRKSRYLRSGELQLVYSGRDIPMCGTGFLGQPRTGQQPVDHAAQGQFVIARCELTQQVPVTLERIRIEILAIRHVQFEKLVAILAPVAAEAVVNDEGAAGTGIGEQARGAAVGRDHALFDQALGQQFLAGFDMVDVAPDR
jgi:hypothetical protein